jgi:leader peptidase (prepilin peptidase)/N-methyltransferase
MSSAFDFYFNNPVIRTGLFFILGLCFGSFITAFNYRVPRNMNWISDRSRCTKCNHILGVIDLMPVVSWLVLRARCRHCGVRISMRYPLIELGCGLGCALIAWLSTR